MKNERKYWVKSAYRTNLDSMHTSVMNYIYDMMGGEGPETITILGEEMDFNRLYEFKEELETLIDLAWGKVTGKEYGRIKEISDERNMWRYMRNIAAGKSEDVAAYSFLE